MVPNLSLKALSERQPQVSYNFGLERTMKNFEDPGYSHTSRRPQFRGLCFSDSIEEPVTLDSAKTLPNYNSCHHAHLVLLVELLAMSATLAIM